MESITFASPQISIGAELHQWRGVEGSAVFCPTRAPRAVQQICTEFLFREKACQVYLLG